MKWFASLCVAAIEWLFSAWMFMLVVGVVHAEWMPQLAPIGYGLALLLAAILSAAVAVRTVLNAVVVGLTGDGS